MDRMTPTDAGFYFAESRRTPMHVGSVAIFEGPAPSYGDLVRLLLRKLPLVPRYRQRVRDVPFYLGRPVWTDDEHFQILYHIRHTAVPKPGGPEQLRNLAGRVLGHRLDLTKPLWELWLIEGLAEGRWAIINKHHHAMIDGVAGTDLMQILFDTSPQTTYPAPDQWTPRPPASTTALIASSLSDTVVKPLWELAAALPAGSRSAIGSPGQLVRRAGVLAGALVSAGRQFLTPAAASLNGPIGPHRRWTWADSTMADVSTVRKAFGGTTNDVVLAAITAGFRDLLEARGELTDGQVVRSMVPVSIRREDERGVLSNRVSLVYINLPVSEPSPQARLEAVRRQMDAHKRALRAYDPRSLIAVLDVIAPGLLALGTRTLLRSTQPLVQAVTTNIPGPPVPLYLLGHRMISLYPCVPIGSGLRTSVGIFSYCGTITFGINVDFDAVPDVDVLTLGISRGMSELVKQAEQKPAEPGADRRRPKERK